MKRNSNDKDNGDNRSNDMKRNLGNELPADITKGLMMSIREEAILHQKCSFFKNTV